MPEARFYLADASGTAQCTLCPHHCRIQSGANGLCRVRRTVRAGNGVVLELPYYGYITALALDPIEKKPLYHWRPGSSILSVGFAGCNLRCPFCQNWHISQSTGIPGRSFSPETLTTAAEKQRASAIAYTYSEPLVHAEFLADCMQAARKGGIANVLVTNGCINTGPGETAAEEILALTDAANIDLKCFSHETYSKILGGDLSTVLDFIRMAVKLDVHVEITTLVVPGLNDTGKELDSIAEFIAGLEKENQNNTAIAWHLSAYHPGWKWNAPPTEPEKLTAAAERARKILTYVYTGNISGEQNDTPCLHCGAALIKRRGYRIDTGGLLRREAGYFCTHCGGTAPIRY
jgi:pyruvate formate lyase activating enzyme